MPIRTKEVMIVNNRLKQIGVGFRASAKKNSHHVAVFVCECGTKTLVCRKSVKRGDTKSCGCLNSETTSQRNRTTGTKHNSCGSPEYHSWTAMKARCNSPSSKDFANYGGRGIKICDQWQRSFRAFMSDMGERPPGTSLDRIDNDKDYSPENCRWATPKQQCANMRVNVRLEHKGHVHTVTEWAEILGMSASTLFGRLDNGWTHERALTEKVKGRVRCPN